MGIIRTGIELSVVFAEAALHDWRHPEVRAASCGEPRRMVSGKVPFATSSFEAFAPLRRLRMTASVRATDVARRLSSDSNVKQRQ
jgi:hypothetical protein